MRRSTRKWHVTRTNSMMNLDMIHRLIQQCNQLDFLSEDEHHSLSTRSDIDRICLIRIDAHGAFLSRQFHWFFVSFHRFKFENRRKDRPSDSILSENKQILIHLIIEFFIKEKNEKEIRLFFDISLHWHRRSFYWSKLLARRIDMSKWRFLVVFILVENLSFWSIDLTKWNNALKLRCEFRYQWKPMESNKK